MKSVHSINGVNYSLDFYFREYKTDIHLAGISLWRLYSSYCAYRSVLVILPCYRVSRPFKVLLGWLICLFVCLFVWLLVCLFVDFFAEMDRWDTLSFYSAVIPLLLIFSTKRGKFAMSPELTLCHTKVLYSFEWLTPPPPPKEGDLKSEYTLLDFIIIFAFGRCLCTTWKRNPVYRGHEKEIKRKKERKKKRKKDRMKERKKESKERKKERKKEKKRIWILKF